MGVTISFTPWLLLAACSDLGSRDNPRIRLRRLMSSFFRFQFVFRAELRHGRDRSLLLRQREKTYYRILFLEFRVLFLLVEFRDG